MSRIGRLSIKIPFGVFVNFSNNTVSIKGPMGFLSQYIDPSICINIKQSEILFTNVFSKEKKYKSFHGLYRSLVNNMIIGVTKGFEKELELVGVGYKVSLGDDNTLKLYLGYSHAIFFKLPLEILVKLIINKEKNHVILFKSIDKQLLGQVVSKIRFLRKVDPYKGRGIRFVGEKIIKKSGKENQK